MIDQMQDEIQQLRAQVTQLKADGAAELLKHRDEKAGMLQKIQNQKEKIHDLNTRHLEDVTLAGVRDRRIAELEGGLNRIGVSIAVSGTGGVVMDEVKALDLIDALTKGRSSASLTCSTGYCSCAAKSERVAELEAALKDCISQIQALCSSDDVPDGVLAALAGKGVNRG